MAGVSQTPEEWARAARFDHPVRWGEVEDAILDWDLPPLESETGNRVTRGGVFGLVGLIGVLLYGAAVRSGPRPVGWVC